MAEIDYALNTFYLLMTGALVMWMAAGFTMLEAGFVRRRNTAEIVTKNIGLYSIACFMYLLCRVAVDLVSLYILLQLTSFFIYFTFSF